MWEPLDILQDEVLRTSWPVTLTMKTREPWLLVLGERPDELSHWPLTIGQTRSLVLNMVRQGSHEYLKENDTSGLDQATLMTRVFDSYRNGTLKHFISEGVRLNVGRMFDITMLKSDQASDAVTSTTTSAPGQPAEALTFVLAFSKQLEGPIIPLIVPVSQSATGRWVRNASEEAVRVTRILDLSLLSDTSEWKDQVVGLCCRAKKPTNRMGELFECLVQSRIDAFSKPGELFYGRDISLNFGNGLKWSNSLKDDVRSTKIPPSSVRSYDTTLTNIRNR